MSNPSWVFVAALTGIATVAGLAGGITLAGTQPGEPVLAGEPQTLLAITSSRTDRSPLSQCARFVARVDDYSPFRNSQVVTYEEGAWVGYHFMDDGEVNVSVISDGIMCFQVMARDDVKPSVLRLYESIPAE